MTTWDPTKHPHGVHGHWANVGGTKTGRKKVDRSVEEGRGAIGYGPAAFKPPSSASTRRARKEKVAGSARSAVATYNKLDRGQPTTFSERDNISYQSPKSRDRAMATRGTVIMPRREAVRSQAHVAKLFAGDGREARVGIKKTFTGKTVVVRSGFRSPGVRRNFDAAPKKSARSIMSKPAAKPSTPQQYTRSQLTLKSDAWMRDRLKERGVTIPKGARTKALVNLLAGD